MERGCKLEERVGGLFPPPQFSPISLGKIHKRSRGAETIILLAQGQCSEIRLERGGGGVRGFFAPPPQFFFNTYIFANLTQFPIRIPLYFPLLTFPRLLFNFWGGAAPFSPPPPSIKAGLKAGLTELLLHNI